MKFLGKIKRVTVLEKDTTIKYHDSSGIEYMLIIRHNENLALDRMQTIIGEPISVQMKKNYVVKVQVGGVLGGLIGGTVILDDTWIWRHNPEALALS